MAADAQPLLNALTRRDAEAVGPALMDSIVLVPATEEQRPAGTLHEDGSREVVAFTDNEIAKRWRADFAHVAAVRGRDLVDLALEMDARALRLDPGAPHGGFLDRNALEELAKLPRTAGPDPLEAPGDWATEELSSAVREAVAAEPGLSGVWLAERAERRTIVLDLAAGGESDVAIEAIVAALRPHLSQGTRIDFLILDEDRRAEAQALGEPLR